MSAIFTLIKALFQFSINQGFLSKESWSVVQKNKYLLYIVLAIVLQFLTFIYAINQAHLRLHREDAYVEKIAELENKIKADKLKNSPAVKTEENRNVETDLETLIQDSQDEYDKHPKQNPN